MLVRCPSCQSSYRLDPERVPQHAVRVRCPRCTAVFRVAPPETALSAPPPPAPRPVPGAADDLGIEREAWQPPRRAPDPPRPAPGAPPLGGRGPSGPALPKRPAWTGETERTLDFGSGAPKPPPPRLETTPFRPGGPAVEPVPAAPAAPVAPAPPASPAPPGRATPGAPGPMAEGPSAFGSLRAAGMPTPPAGVGVPPVTRSGFQTAPPVAVARPAVSPAGAPASASSTTGPAHTRARRLARVLVSDLLVYNQAARDRALQEGSLASVLAPEISKAWDLYKTKVGPEVAISTPYFKDALNEILAGGAAVF